MFKDYFNNRKKKKKKKSQGMDEKQLKGQYATIQT
jgi:hypothetical protein